MFEKIYNYYIPDTQTGLRIYSKNSLNNILKIESNGFEFELEALIMLIRRNENLKFLEINTIYNKEKNASHFKPIKDSYKIYKIMLLDGRKIK